MAEDLIILGCGVHAKEMVEILERLNGVEETWNLLGFVSPDEKHVGETLNGYPVLGSSGALADYPDARLALAYGWPHSTEDLSERLASIIDPSCFVSRTARIERGCVLYPGCFVGYDARIEEGVFCLGGCIINHDVVIELGTTLASAVTLAGYAHVEPGCYLGQSCTIRQEIRIGRGSMIGMGAVVVKDVPPNCVMVGNPARKLRDRDGG